MIASKSCRYQQPVIPAKAGMTEMGTETFNLPIMKKYVVKRKKLKNVVPILFFLILFLSPCFLWAQLEQRIIQSDAVSVVFEDPLKNAAEEVITLYPLVKSELEESLRWELDIRPTVVLVHDEKTFQKMAGHDLFVAFASPKRNLIVIDHSKMNRHPFSLKITLKHEMCHLLLHHHIKDENLPKWLDEGVCQWLSDGISEFISDRKRFLLNEAVLSGKFIPLPALTYRFPRDRRSISLAYEESKSFINYLEKEFGRETILAILNDLKHGDSVEDAIQKRTNVSFETLEKQWRADLKKTTTWFVYLAIHIYDILFFLSGLILIYGFIRLVIKKRSYQDEEEDDEEWEEEDA
jgi:hypothetical protein